MKLKRGMLDALAHVAMAAVGFVGTANFPEREAWAKQEVDRCWRAARAGRKKSVVFNDVIPEPGEARCPRRC